MTKASLADDTIRYSIAKTNVACNKSAPGKIQINATSQNGVVSHSWSTGATTNIISDLESGTYTDTLKDPLGNDTTVTVTIIDIECEMVPERFFSPNSDGYNDTWFVNNWSFFPNALILVYDRWGQKVYEHKGLYDEAWDGKNILGIPVPDGAYYYIVYKDKSNEKDLKKGSVSILR